MDLFRARGDHCCRIIEHPPLYRIGAARGAGRCQPGYGRHDLADESDSRAVHANTGALSSRIFAAGAGGQLPGFHFAACLGSDFDGWCANDSLPLGLACNTVGK